MRSVRDRGSVSLWLIIFTLAVLVLLGYVVDGGQYMNSREQAADIAQQAARAAADDLQTGPLRNGDFVIDQAACDKGGPAYALVSQYAGGAATISGCMIGGQTTDGHCLPKNDPPPPGGFVGPCVSVTVSIKVSPALPLGPFGTFTTGANESASLACGTNTSPEVC
jgi:hypothetical protein